MLKVLYNTKTGEATTVEAVDAREILKNSPELYSEVPPKGKKAAAPNANAAQASRISDSLTPEDEFKRRVTEEDQVALARSTQAGLDALAAQKEKEAGEGKGKASDGMTVAELKTALDEKGIEHKAGMAKADLQALLDAS